MNVLDLIMKKLKEKNKPVKILLSLDAYDVMVKEENLIGLFCTNCKNFVEGDNKHCSVCSLDKETLIKKELSIHTIVDLPFEVSSNVTREDIVRII